MKYSLFTPFYVLLTLILVMFSGCTDDDPIIIPDAGNKNVIVINEGSFGSPNGEISLYDISEKVVVNDIYGSSNMDDLGDTFQSLTLIGNRYYAVIQSSGYINILDTSSFESVGRIEGLQVPKYMIAVDEEHAYVTTGYGHHIIYKLSLSENRIVGEIPLRGIGGEVAISNGLIVIAAESKIYLLDPAEDVFVDSLQVGANASAMQKDLNGDIWVSCGGRSWDPIEQPSLYKINVADRTAEEILVFPGFGGSANLKINGSLDTLYLVNDNIYQLPVANPSAYQSVYNTSLGSIIYGLGVDPISSEIYIADAIDFVQRGVVSRLSPDGGLVDQFTVGLIPNGFLFKE